MDADLLRLFPAPAEPVPIKGIYLEHGLRATAHGGPFLYTNFIASLDGRIAQPDPISGLRRVPPAIANARDWRLYMELAAQADVVLTTGRHLRAVTEGRHGDLLAVGDGKFADLGRWRTASGLPPKPTVAVVSEALDFSAAALGRAYSGPVLALTTDRAPSERIRDLQHHDVDVIRAGGGPGLHGTEILSALDERGLSCIYSIAGPRVLEALLTADVVDRFYLTVATAILGGEGRDTLLPGPRAFDPPIGFTLKSLYLDNAAPEGANQLFVCLERKRR